MSSMKTLYLLAAFFLTTCLMAVGEHDEAGELCATEVDFSEAPDMCSRMERMLSAEIIVMIYEQLTEATDRQSFSYTSKYLCSLRPALKKVSVQGIQGLYLIFEKGPRSFLDLSGPMDLELQIEENGEAIKFIRPRETQVKLLRVTSGYRLSDADLAALAPGLINLESLDFRNHSPLTNAGLQCLPRQLRRLRLNGCCLLTDAGLEVLLRFTQLQRLRLHDFNQVSDAGLAHLTALTQLERLDLSGCRRLIGQGLGHMSKWPQLRRLHLWNCENLGDASVVHLARLTQLESLALAGTPATDTGMEALTGLTQLRRLYLWGRVSDTGLRRLAELTQLQFLSLCGCRQVTDVGVAHLVALTQLRSLCLSYCEHVTDASLAALTALTQLRHLDLFCCKRVTDTGLAYLANLPQLESLNVSGCSVTQAGIDALKQRCPNLKITPSESFEIGSLGMDSLETAWSFVWSRALTLLNDLIN